MKPLRLFARRTPAERRLFFEAVRWLVWAKAMLWFRPFRAIAPELGEPQAETPAEIAAADRATAVAVSWAVQAAARYLPLGFVCLPQAMAAQRMLRRRAIPSTLYLGVAPDRADRRAIQAHAWLRAGDKIVTGEAETRRHKVLASFAGR